MTCLFLIDKSSTNMLKSIWMCYEIHRLEFYTNTVDANNGLVKTMHCSRIWNGCFVSSQWVLAIFAREMHVSRLNDEFDYNFYGHF